MRCYLSCNENDLSTFVTSADMLDRLLETDYTICLNGSAGYVPSSMSYFDVFIHTCQINLTMQMDIVKFMIFLTCIISLRNTIEFNTVTRECKKAFARYTRSVRCNITTCTCVSDKDDKFNIKCQIN